MKIQFLTFGARVACRPVVIIAGDGNLDQEIFATCAVAAALGAPASGATITYFTRVTGHFPGLTGFSPRAFVDGIRIRVLLVCQLHPTLAGRIPGPGQVASRARLVSFGPGDTFSPDVWSFVFDPNSNSVSGESRSTADRSLFAGQTKPEPMDRRRAGFRPPMA
jgi:hypothetical protein